MGFALTAVGSVAGYFALQVLAAFVAFFIYGSGETFAAKSGNVSGLFVAAQFVAVLFLFYRKVWVKKVPALLLALFIPLGLFLALEGSRLLLD
jgi:hypothetical protein